MIGIPDDMVTTMQSTEMANRMLAMVKLVMEPALAETPSGV